MRQQFVGHRVPCHATSQHAVARPRAGHEQQGGLDACPGGAAYRYTVVGASGCSTETGLPDITMLLCNECGERVVSIPGRANCLGMFSNKF